MGNRIIFVILVVLFSHLPLIDSTSAQWVPAVDLECQAINPSGNLEINVTAESNETDYADCTVSNPNMYKETIRISVNSGALAHASPNEIYVEANSEVDFQVIVRAENMTLNQTSDLTIFAEVVEVNGLPPPTSASSESNLLVEVTVYEEVNEIENIISEKSDNQSLIYAGSGGAVLLILILFVVLKRRK